MKEEGLRSEAKLLGDDWPDRWSTPPVAESFGHTILIHANCTIGMPRALGEFLYVRGGSVTTELDHAHHPIVLRATYWPLERKLQDWVAIMGSVRTRLGAEVPEARLASQDNLGALSVWLAGEDPITLARAAVAFGKRHELRCSLHIEEGATEEDPLRDRRAGAEPV